MYKTNKDVRESLLIGMVQAVVAKLSGHPNPGYAVIVMIFSLDWTSSLERRKTLLLQTCLVRDYALFNKEM